MIEVTGIHTTKSGQKIFRNLNWRINDHEHWVISGPNGSGKTALLELLSGKAYIEKGAVHYDFITGKTWEDQFQEKRRLIQYIPALAMQSLLPAGGEMYYQQRYYSIGDEAAAATVRVRDILGRDHHHLRELDIPSSFDLDPLLDREVKRLSNGQLKKVLILQRLLHHIPRLLLMDYPFEGLDAASRKDLCHFIDLIATTYPVQIIIAGHGNELPRCMTHRLTLDALQIVRQEPVDQTITLSPPPRVVSTVANGATAGEAVVDMRHLKIQYGETVVLEDFNWTVRRGDRWAIVGRNGSGKTTVFSLIFADHPMAYSEEVYLFGRRRGSGESIWDIKKRISYLGPELTSYLDPRAITGSAREFIASRHQQFDHQKLDTLLRFFEAETFIDRPVRYLSSGQLQLALLMSCFMTTKELILLDEPFQFLCPRLRDRVNEFLQVYLRRDTTLILITHYDEDVARWTEKTLRL